MYQAAKELVAVYPKDKVYKDLIMIGIKQLKTTTEHVEHIRHEMNALASTLAEYETVLSMRGLGKSNPSSKCGPSKLRKTLFLIMTSLIQTSPADDRVYQFLDKKRSEGKPYLVYMTVGANKFLRIYYGKVKACIAAQAKSE